MFIIWVKFVEIPKQIFGSQLNAVNWRSLISDKAPSFSQSERALYGHFIIMLFIIYTRLFCIGNRTTSSKIRD